MPISNHKKTLTQKLLTFQKEGLKKYGNYLSDQLKMANKSKNKEVYKKYIINQIALNNKRILNIDIKLKK
ncbi:MAG: hypothetical protein IPM51_08950 [Sphingobacteriaceae bacterium]|nr:hypothetical protein [Sphingobacteriaceae bacterium]